MPVSAAARGVAEAFGDAGITAACCGLEVGWGATTGETAGFGAGAATGACGIDAGGTLNAGFGLSNSDAGTGVRWQLGLQRLAMALNFNLDISGATGAFQLVGAQGSLPKLQLVAGLGKGFYDYGSLRFSVVHQDFYDKEKRTIWSLDYSKRLFGRVSMSTFLSFLDAGERDLSAGVRFNMAFGEHHSARGGISTNRSGTGIDAAVQRNLPMNSGYGYHVAAGSSENSFVDAGVIAQNEYGTYSVDVRNNAYAGTFWQADLRGSVAYMAGMTRVSRQINEAFAVVNVGDLEGVRVYSENLEIGRTNKHGQVFVPGLRPYIKNQLRIELDDLPLNAHIGETQIDTAPYYKSGVVVNFDVHVTTNVLLRAVYPDGRPLPEGAIAEVFHTGEIFPVGMNGKLYLQGIDRSSEIAVRWNGSTCNLDVPYPSGSAVIAKMGDIVCIPERDK